MTKSSIVSIYIKALKYKKRLLQIDKGNSLYIIKAVNKEEWLEKETVPDLRFDYGWKDGYRKHPAEVCTLCILLPIERLNQ